MKRVSDFLQTLGLTEIESFLYHGLLEIGPSTVMDLAKHVGIKRITVHFNVESLIQKGLVTQTKQGSRRKITPESPEILKYLIEKKEDSILKIKSQLPEILTLIHQTIPQIKVSEQVNVKYYKGKNGVRLIYQEALKSKEIRSYVNISMIYRVFPENPQLFPKNVDLYRIKMWEIIEDSSESRSYVKSTNHKQYQYKFFPKEFDKSVFFDYMIFNNRVGIITLEDNVPSGILIENINIYNASKFIYNMLWSLLPSSQCVI